MIAILGLFSKIAIAALELKYSILGSYFMDWLSWVKIVKQTRNQIWLISLVKQML